MYAVLESERRAGDSELGYLLAAMRLNNERRPVWRRPGAKGPGARREVRRRGHVTASPRGERRSELANDGRRSDGE